MAPHRHRVVDVMVTSSRTNTSAPQICARLPPPEFPGSLAFGAQQRKLDADLRTSTLLGTPSVQSVHDYYPFILEDEGRSASMEAELVTCLAILVAICCLHDMGVVASRSLRSK
jgi:hypothetical protein